MKTMKSIGLSLLLAAGAVAGARGQPFRTDINPALLYYQAFLVAPEPMPNADMDFLYSKEGQSHPMPERFAKLAAGYDNEFKLLRQAARATVPCDWGIDMTKGPAALLPHLARCKAAAQAARFRVAWALQHGHQADARDDLLASFALGRNVTRDGTLISVLVQIATEAIDCATLAANFRLFSPETLEQVAAGLDAPPARGTVAACLAMDIVHCHEWLLRKIAELQKANPGDDGKVMAAIRELFSDLDDPDQNPPQTITWERVTQAAGGTSEGVGELIRGLEPLGQKLALILALPYGQYEVPMEQFQAEVRQSPNPFAVLTFPPWGKARARELRMQVWLAMVHAAVEYRLHGDAGLQNIADPCGQGPFALQRFVLDGVDRGFRLTSAYQGSGYPEALIFVEKEGPPFRGDGPHLGEAVP